ncbi:hypothetical protein, partial [Brevibacterium sanguinis]|uniref:hypothetical protein n=1 Tax=Brevibacterium sanguinis TaxID=232444 RepID=UPI001C690222
DPGGREEMRVGDAADASAPPRFVFFIVDRTFQMSVLWSWARPHQRRGGRLSHITFSYRGSQFPKNYDPDHNPPISVASQIETPRGGREIPSRAG